MGADDLPSSVAGAVVWIVRPILGVRAMRRAVMSRLNVGRMWRHGHRAQLNAWEAELREAGALPLIAREILADMANQCERWENLQCVMPQVIRAAQVNGVNNDAVLPALREAAGVSR